MHNRRDELLCVVSSKLRIAGLWYAPVRERTACYDMKEWLQEHINCRLKFVLVLFRPSFVLRACGTLPSGSVLPAVYMNVVFCVGKSWTSRSSTGERSDQVEREQRNRLIIPYQPLIFGRAAGTRKACVGIPPKLIFACACACYKIMTSSVTTAFGSDR